MKTTLCFTYIKHWGMLLCMFLISCNADQRKDNNLTDLQSAQNLSDDDFEVYYDTTKGPIIPPEYIEYVETPTSGLSKTKEVNSFIYTVQYTPLAYLSIKEYKKPTITKECLDSLNATYQGMEYFTVTFQHKDGRDVLKSSVDGINDTKQLLSYLDFDMQRDIFLARENDTIPCKLYHFEGRYGVAPELRYTIGFPNESKDKTTTSRTLIIRDKVFSKTEIQFNIKKEALLNLPEVRTETL